MVLLMIYLKAMPMVENGKPQLYGGLDWYKPLIKKQVFYMMVAPALLKKRSSGMVVKPVIVSKHLCNSVLGKDSNY